jgi:transposase InsO family protein
MAAGLRISMDGRGRWMDNVFIERLWRSLKHEDIYLKGCADGREPDAAIGGFGEHGCGHDAALGRRYRVAHMPTAATVTAAIGGLIG